MNFDDMGIPENGIVQCPTCGLDDFTLKDDYFTCTNCSCVFTVDKIINEGIIDICDTCVFYCQTDKENPAECDAGCIKVAELLALEEKGIDTSEFGNKINCPLYKSEPLFDEQVCRVCGCTWDNACEGGCSWVEDDLCSKCEELKIKRIKKMIDEAPDKCIITGLTKCKSYIIDDNVVYLSTPAYDAYTLPEYNSEEKAFYRTRYDMDDENRIEHEHLCDLDELRDREDFEQIKAFYNIQD